VSPERSYEVMQPLLDDAPQAKSYFSDALEIYHSLVYYPGHHRVAPGKSQTYSVEADNAEFRHYLARLARRSRCFSRCIHALRLAVRLFVFCWNHRQLYRQAHPAYPAHLIDFVPIRC
jgi:insertion element IS1 protein InsB